MRSVKKQIQGMSLEEKIKEYQYKFLMRTPHLSKYSLTQHLVFNNYIEDQKKLFIKDLTSKEQNQIGFQVPCPNLYIQKIRAIYFLLLTKTYEKSSSYFQKAFKEICLNFYQNDQIKPVSKKFMAEFMQLLTFQSKNEDLIFNNLNKYPIIDQIFIDMFIEGIEKNCIGVISPDDNYNIIQFLQKLNLSCEARTLWEIRVENYLIRAHYDSFYINSIEKTNIENDSFSTVEENEDVDLSVVRVFSDNVFQREKSFIDLLSFLVEDEQIKKQIPPNPPTNEKNQTKLQSFLKVGKPEIKKKQGLNKTVILKYKGSMKVMRKGQVKEYKN